MLIAKITRFIIDRSSEAVRKKGKSKYLQSADQYNQIKPIMHL